MSGKSKMLASMFALMVACVEPACADEAPKTSAHEDRGVAEQIREAAENVGKKIDQAVTAAAKKFEEQRVGERLRETIKNAATRTGEELKRIGKKIKDKFSKEGSPSSASSHGFLRNPKKAPATPAPADGK